MTILQLRRASNYNDPKGCHGGRQSRRPPGAGIKAALFLSLSIWLSLLLLLLLLLIVLLLLLLLILLLLLLSLLLLLLLLMLLLLSLLLLLLLSELFLLLPGMLRRATVLWICSFCCSPSAAAPGFRREPNGGGRFIQFPFVATTFVASRRCTNTFFFCLSLPPPLIATPIRLLPRLALLSCAPGTLCRYVYCICLRCLYDMTCI